MPGNRTAAAGFRKRIERERAEIAATVRREARGVGIRGLDVGERDSAIRTLGRLARRGADRDLVDMQAGAVVGVGEFQQRAGGRGIADDIEGVSGEPAENVALRQDRYT